VDARALLSRRSVRLAAVVAGLVLAWSLLGFLAVPAIAKRQLASLLTAELGRPVTVARVAFNPFTLRAEVDGLAIGGRSASQPPLLTLARLEADAAWRSVIERAPVLESLRIVEPKAHLARAADGRLDVDDLIRKWAGRPQEPDAPPPRFSVANIAVAGGALSFDDRVEDRRHEVAGLQVQVPFVSSLPVHETVHVEPKVAATVNGARVEIAGRSLPFADEPASTIEFEVAPIDLAPYVGYLPQDLPVRVASLVFGADLRIVFAQPQKGPPSLTVNGRATIANLDLRTPAGAPLLSAQAIEASGVTLEPLSGRAGIERIDVRAPQATVHRARDEARFLEPVLAALERGVPANAAAAGGARPWQWRIGRVALEGGQVDFADERFAPKPLAIQASGVEASVEGLSGDLSAALPFTLSASLSSGERLAVGGRLRPAPLVLEADASVEAVSLRQWWWLARPWIDAELRDGTFGARAGVRVALGDRGVDLALQGLAAKLEGLRLDDARERRELLRVASLGVSDVSMDLAKRTLRLGRLESAGGRISLARDRTGTLNLARIAARAGPATDGMAAPPGAASAAVTAGAPAAPAGWSFVADAIAIERWDALYSDRLAGASGDLSLSGLSLRAERIGNQPGTRGRVMLQSRTGSGGVLSARGEIGLAPLAAKLRIDAQQVGLVPLQPYFTQFINAVISSGRLSLRGDLTLEAPSGKPLRAGFAGDASVNGFGAVAKSNGDELLRWRALRVGGVDLALEPLALRLGEIALDDFYARLVLNADGRLNLQDLVVASPPPGGVGAAGSGAVAGGGAASVDPAATMPSTTTGRVTAAQLPPSQRADVPLPVRIDRIALTNGNVLFSDFFVRPNYSANLTGLSGTVSALAPDAAGELSLRGRIDDSGSVEVTGRLNPLAPALFLDLTARAKDIDLPRTSPYSVKYLGYGIEKGKLSANVRYTLKDRRLEAENNIVLDQLTFGEKVESPTATKLPVLFAVSLLKDRHGVIDVNLPIGGSLDDPEFSVGGLVLRIIFNLIAKAVTAPFTLIANLAGGGPELSQVVFAAGRARLDPEADSRLEALSRALKDRPGLRLDLTGRADPAQDREALRAIALDRMLQAQKLRQQPGAPSPDAVTIAPDEREALLRLAYRAADFPRPRNAIGLLRDQSAAEMERMLLEHVAVPDEALAALADERARVVKEWLLQKGGIDGARVFVLASKPTAEGLGEGRSTTSVQLSLK